MVDDVRGIVNADRGSVVSHVMTEQLVTYFVSKREALPMHMMLGVHAGDFPAIEGGDYEGINPIWKADKIVLIAKVGDNPLQVDGRRGKAAIFQKFSAPLSSKASACPVVHKVPVTPLRRI